MSIQRRQWQPTPVLLPGKSLGWRSLVGCSPWGCEESDTTSLSLSCIGEGNDNPLQCSCLENPGDRRASWASVYGVAQSRTRLKRLSSNLVAVCIYTYIYIYIYTSPPSWTFLPTPSPSRPSRPPAEPELSSLCCTAAPH